MINFTEYRLLHFKPSVNIGTAVEQVENIDQDIQAQDPQALQAQKEFDEIHRQLQSDQSAAEYREYWKKKEGGLQNIIEQAQKNQTSWDSVKKAITDLQDAVRKYTIEIPVLRAAYVSEVSKLRHQGLITEEMEKAFIEGFDYTVNDETISRPERMRYLKEYFSSLAETKEVYIRIKKERTDFQELKEMKLEGGKKAQSLHLFSEADFAKANPLFANVELLFQGKLSPQIKSKDLLTSLKNEKAKLLAESQKRNNLLKQGKEYRDELVNSYREEPWIASLKTFHQLKGHFKSLLGMAKGQAGVEEYFSALFETAEGDWKAAGGGAEEKVTNLREKLVAGSDWQESKVQHEEMLEELMEVYSFDPSALTPSLRKEIKLYMKNIEICILGLGAEDFNLEMEQGYESIQRTKEEAPEKALAMSNDLSSLCARYFQGKPPDVINECWGTYQLILLLQEELKNSKKQNNKNSEEGLDAEMEKVMKAKEGDRFIALVLLSWDRFRQLEESEMYVDEKMSESEHQKFLAEDVLDDHRMIVANDDHELEGGVLLDREDKELVIAESMDAEAAEDALEPMMEKETYEVSVDRKNLEHGSTKDAAEEAKDVIRQGLNIRVKRGENSKNVLSFSEGVREMSSQFRDRIALSFANDNHISTAQAEESLTRVVHQVSRVRTTTSRRASELIHDVKEVAA